MSSLEGTMHTLAAAWTSSTVQLLAMSYTETDAETSSSVSANCSQTLVGSTNGTRDPAGLKTGRVRTQGPPGN